MKITKLYACVHAVMYLIAFILAPILTACILELIFETLHTENQILQCGIQEIDFALQKIT